jgi:hypothetical protein
LIGVCAAVGTDGCGLATPDEFRAALAEVAPAAERVLGGGAVAAGVPAFHGVNAPAIGDCVAGEVDRFGEWRALGGGEDFFVDRQGNAELAKPGAEGRDGLELGDLGVVGVGAHGAVGGGLTPGGAGGCRVGLVVGHFGCGAESIFCSKSP